MINQKVSVSFVAKNVILIGDFRNTLKDIRGNKVLFLQQATFLSFTKEKRAV
jgi:hypothetical protein